RRCVGGLGGRCLACAATVRPIKGAVRASRPFQTTVVTTCGSGLAPRAAWTQQSPSRALCLCARPERLPLPEHHQLTVWTLARRTITVQIKVQGPSLAPQTSDLPTPKETQDEAPAGEAWGSVLRPLRMHTRHHSRKTEHGFGALVCALLRGHTGQDWGNRL
ncbi:hypothetical protein MC885_020740, partial [Smutsia gigantea]